jgi:Ion channel
MDRPLATPAVTPERPLAVMAVLILLLVIPTLIMRFEILDLFWGEPRKVDASDIGALVFSGYFLLGRMTLLLIIGRLFYQIPRLSKPWNWIESGAFAMFAVMALTSIVFFYARMYRDYGLKDGDSVVHDATTSLYFSLITWTTVGYGDVVPTPAIRLFAASEGVVSYIGMAALIVVIARLISKADWVRELAPAPATATVSKSPNEQH